MDVVVHVASVVSIVKCIVHFRAVDGRYDSLLRWIKGKGRTADKSEQGQAWARECVGMYAKRETYSASMGWASLPSSGGVGSS